MSPILSRRSLLRLSSLAGAGLLAACTTTSSGGTASVTIDVARILADSQAIVTALEAALAAPTLVALLGTDYATAVAALAAAKLVLGEIQALGATTITLAVDINRMRALVASLLSDVQTVLRLAQGPVSKLTGSTATTVGNALAAVESLVPLLQLAAGLAGSRQRGPMTEGQALSAASRLAP